MPKMRLTWKWKIAIALVVLAIFLVGWTLSETGHFWMKRKIVERMRALPEAQQRESWWAGRYLDLASWAANVRGDTKQAMGMYQQFCGIATGPEAQEAVNVYQQYCRGGRPKEIKPPFDQRGMVTGKFSGLCSVDGSIGCGPLHPRAPEAYWKYLEIYDTQVLSKQPFFQEVYKFYRLFYEWYISHSPQKKPHPMFSVYWAKIRYRLKHEPVDWAGNNIDPTVPLAPPPPKEE